MERYSKKIEYFGDIYSFINTINSRRNNQVFRCVQNKSKKYGSWYGSYDWEESCELLKNGWNTGTKELKALTQGVKINVPKIVKNVKGFSPSVPDALSGKPKSMYDKSFSQEKRKMMNIVVSSTGGAGATKEIIKVGAIAINICNALESQGIRCNIYSIPQMTFSGSEIIGCLVKIKDCQQPMNLKKVAYPLGHTSWFRRQGFLYLETSPNVTEKSFKKNYGCAVFHYNEHYDVYKETLSEVRKKVKDAAFVNFNICQNCDYDAEKVMERVLQEVK